MRKFKKGDRVYLKPDWNCFVSFIQGGGVVAIKNIKHNSLFFDFKDSGAHTPKAFALAGQMKFKFAY
jgi:hypothetical protein